MFLSMRALPRRMDEKEILDRMRVVEYAPNLRIAGTLHSLTVEEKTTLEKLIDESDFVAVEWDKYRRRDSNTLGLAFGEERRGWDRDSNIVSCSLFDALYFSFFLELLNVNIVKANREMKRGLVNGVGCMKSMDFCCDYADKKSKDTYLVDMPLGALAQRLFELPGGIKLRHLWAMMRRNGWPAEVDYIVVKERNQVMLSGIEEREGPIMGLKRKGLLVVGLEHAKLYQEELEARQQEQYNPLEGQKGSSGDQKF
jgi:hypothetical protein